MICKSIFILIYSQYTIRWDKIQMLKKIPSDKINITKYIIFLLSQVSTHHSFTFNSQFLYELKHMVHLSKTVRGIFHFRFPVVCIKVYIFVQQKTWTLWLSNAIILFKINIIEKQHTVFLSDVWFLSCNKKFGNLMIPPWVGTPQKLSWIRTS